MLNIDRRYNLTGDALDELVLRMRWELPDGTPREVPGEAWGFQIYGPGVAEGQVTASGAIAMMMIDGVEAQFVEMRHLPATGTAIAGLVGLKWKIGEILPSGQIDNLLDEPPTITIRRVPAMSGVTAPLTGEGEILMLVFTEGN